MKFSLCAAASLLFTGMASAAMCISTDLTGGQTLPLSQTFNLYARNSAGSQLPITAAKNPLPSGFFFPLKLAGANAKKSSLPYFQLQNSNVFANGGNVFSTMGTELLTPVPLYISASSDQAEERFFYVNATCDGKAEKVLRFANLTPLPLASAAINGSFAKGTPLLSPILQNLITIDTPVDLIITPTRR